MSLLKSAVFLNQLFLFRDDLGSFPYLTLCIKESMRLHSPVPAVSRRVDTPLDIGGVTLPRGASVNLKTHILHNNRAVWGEDVRVSIVII